ncbi:hypothetical protein ACET3Z_011994 [Daucus carota]
MVEKRGGSDWVSSRGGVGTAREGVGCVNQSEEGLDWSCDAPPIVVDGQATTVSVYAATERCRDGDEKVRRVMSRRE